MKKMAVLYGLAAILAIALMVFAFWSVHASPGSDIQNDLMKKAASPSILQEVNARGIAVYSRRESFMVTDAKGVIPAAGMVVPPVDLLKRCYALAFQDRWQSAVTGSVSVRIATSGAPYSPVSPRALSVTEADQGLRDEALVECIRATAPRWYIDRSLRDGQVITGTLNFVYGKDPGRLGGGKAVSEGAGKNGAQSGGEGLAGDGGDNGSVKEEETPSEFSAVVPKAVSMEPAERPLEKAQIQKVILQNRGLLRNCYVNERLRNPELAAGKVVVRFEIAADGSVQDAKAHEGTTLQDEVFIKCVIDSVRGFRFPEPRNGGKVLVTYPFVFDATDG